MNFGAQMLLSSKKFARAVKFLAFCANFLQPKIIFTTVNYQTFRGLLFSELCNWSFWVQFLVRFEKSWQLDLFLSMKSCVHAHNLHITGGGGLNFWLTLISLMYMYITWGWGGLNFRPTLMYTKKHVFHQLMCGPPPVMYIT